MYELVQVAKNTYYIDCPAKIGLVKLDGSNVCLIDSGNDKDAGRKIRQILDRNGWQLTAIYNTHSNADHIGGNKYLQGQTGCKVFARGIDADFTNHPVLEPSFLYGGFAPQALRHKFLMAQESVAEQLTRQNLPEGMEFIELPGHFFDMVGFKAADDVIFLADCLSSEETLRKYGITFVYDVAAYLETLEKVKQMKAAMFVPAHAEATENIAPLAQHNIDQVHEIAHKIVDVCSEPRQFEQVLQKMFEEFALTMNFDQYVLIGSTVRSYLAWLTDLGRMQYFFERGKMLWEKV